MIQVIHIFSMISNYDKEFNKISKLENSKWTSLKKLNGWKHYEVININKKNNQIELFAVCENKIRVIVQREVLQNKQIWKRGWEDFTT
tara:strand:+ start:47 stop:310 length:264 start_codon:yes stop_codon:yes gene_type:complete